MKIKGFKSFLFLIGFCFSSVMVQGQIRYVESSELHIGGKVKHAGNTFHRLDMVVYQDLPANIKKLMTNSSGMYLSFQSNSSKIVAEWCTSSAKTYPNLPGIAFEGLDLYVKENGKWIYAGVGRPTHQNCQTQTLVENMENSEKEFLLYLPLYDEITSFKLGIDSSATYQVIKPFSTDVAFYGTSIVQGASASRPGLNYTSKLSRNLGIEAINWGVSGSARMEKSVSKMIGEMDLDVLVLDCIPNCSPEHIDERTKDFILEIREKHPNLPILAIAGAPFESGNFNTKVKENMRLRNLYFEKHIKDLMREDSNLYFLSGEGLLGEDHEGTIDGTHPNDIGFERMIQKIEPELKNILLKYNLIEKFN